MDEKIQKKEHRDSTKLMVKWTWGWQVRERRERHSRQRISVNTGKKGQFPKTSVLVL